MIKRKICVITGSRAEYGLLYCLMKQIELNSDTDLQLIVTGMHLSPDYGLTYKEIENDFKIQKKINMDLSTDTSLAISKSMALAQISFSKAFNELKPDIVTVLGDRYEILSAVIAALIANIPIAHIHGGELSEGSWDNSIRHSISKMSHIHFPATEEYKKRIIQLGEEPDKIFNVGGLGIENIQRIKLLSKNQFEESIEFKLNKKNILVTYHPTTLENHTSQKHFQELLNAIDELNDTNIIFTKANSDLDGRIINQMIDDYVIANSKKSVCFISLGQLKYLSALQYVDTVVGNSSSGLIEAPSFNVGTINIGERQRGRIKAASVIDCLPEKKEILKSFEKIYSKDFQKLLKTIKNPYDNGQSSKKIVEVLKNFKLENILKKKFYNISFNYDKY